MVWFNVDDTLAFHQKTIRAGNPAIGLWVRAGSWCAQTLTDGFVPKAVARSLGTSAQARALVEADLWEMLPSGYRFPNWEERQRTKEEVEAARESERTRKAVQRKRKNVPAGQPAGLPPDTTRLSQPESQGDSLPESRQVSGHPSHTKPYQALKTSGKVGGVALVSEREGDPEPPPNCPRHPNGTTEPCGPCGDARRASLAWTSRQALAESARRSTEARDRAALRAEQIADCPECDDDGYRGTAPCDHDPDHTDRATRGSAAVRAALAKSAPNA